MIPQLPSSTLTLDLRPASRGVHTSCISSFGNNGNNCDMAGGSGLTSPLSEPIPGPSGCSMGPVQDVPLVKYNSFFF